MDFSAAPGGGLPRTLLWIAALALFALGAGLLSANSWLGRVRYQLNAGTLTASGQLSGVRVPIDAASALRVEVLRDLRRAGGEVPGPGACVGEYRSQGYARLLMYGDCTSPAVVFVAGGLRYAVTPGDPEAFVAAWRDGLSLDFAPPVRPAAFAARRSAALCAALGGLIALLLVRARRLCYSLTSAGLAVPTAFGELKVPYGQITRVRRSPAQLGAPLLALRLPGYAVGRFIWHGAPAAVDAAASSGRAPGVLVEYRGRHLFLTPRDPVAFASELERRRARMTHQGGRR